MSPTATKTPPRDQIPAEKRWNLKDLFVDFADWETAFGRLESDVERFAEHEGRLGEGTTLLREVLQHYDRLDDQAQRLWWYPALMHDEDLRRNEIASYKQRITTLLASMGTATSWTRPQILALGEDTVRRWLDEDEELAVYRFFLLDLFRQQKHVLDEDRETLLSYTAQLASAPRDAYSMLSGADAQWPTITLENGEETTLTYSTYHHLLSTSRSAVDRRCAFENLYGVFTAHKNTYAALYGAVCHRDWFYARSRGYGSTLQAALDGNDIDEGVVDNLLQTTRASTAPLQRYFRLRQRVLGLPSMHLYDGQVPLVERDRPYSFDEALAHVVASVAPLGEEYQSMLSSAFSQGWVDVYENEGKRSGAYSAPVHGVHPYVLMNYKDTRGDMFTLAHEMGHSLHTVLAQRSQPYVYSDYTIFVAEVASTFNEGLLLDHLLERCTEADERALLLQHAIDSIVGTFYTQVLFADFELQAHRAVEEGHPVTADSLSEIYARLMQDYYGDSIEHDEAYAMTWARIPHLYRTPYYVYQYATCFASAAALRKALHEDQATGATRLLTLLGQGSSSHPMDQLVEAGVDLRQKQPIVDVITRFDELVAELEKVL